MTISLRLTLFCFLPSAVTLMGALLFLAFALIGFLQGPDVDLRAS